ncbi:30S ribosomal protein S4 [candidate division NPL-UPA2 bacterium]|nr:30S ribosomal protein S4 [candidate division NPL-UPA2 bacterium]
MARHIGPVCKLCRREGEKLFLKGNKCLGPKCILEKRNSPPGQGKKQKFSDYGLRLREKQKLRRMYGLLDRQFRSYFRMAEKKKGITGEILLQLLERRLDNIVFRLGFATSRNEARQLVRHSHFQVNGRRVNIPSYLIKAGDTIRVKEKSKKVVRIKEIMELTKEREVPGWLELDRKSLAGTVAKIPSREEIAVPIQEKLIVELLSR